MVPTALSAARDLLAADQALHSLDQAHRVMVTTYAGHVPHEARVEFGAHYFGWWVHRRFAQQWLARLPAANDQHGAGAA